MIRQWVFDFDDTLVRTGSRVFLTRADGRRVDLLPAQFASYVKEPGDSFDFSEFKELIDPRPIDVFVGLMREAAQTHGSAVAIVSARSVPRPIELFLGLVGVEGVEVVALADSDPTAKMRWIGTRLATGRIGELDFYDDSARNVAAIESLREAWPHVRLRCHHVVT